jgi:hypothetical protein
LAAWYFREALVAQLPRIIKVGPVSLGPPVQAILSEPSSGDDVIRQVESYITPEMMAEGRKLVEGKVPRNAQNEKIDELSYLRSLSAALLIAGLYERTNGVIWGSQLLLMQQANSAPQTLETARAIYDRAAAAFPLTYVNYTFEQWMHFLEVSLLIKREPDSTIVITLRGRGFLSYLTQNGYPTIRIN